MDWVKSLTGYYRLLEIATGSDAMEVMFKRADALAGELGSDGFIPDAMLPQLTRRPAQAKKIAQELVDAGLWIRVQNGYLIVDWASINNELVRLQDRKRRDRDRKRAERAASRDASVDSPADCPVDSLYESERKTQSKTSATAEGRTAAAAVVESMAVEILADKLRTHTVLRTLRTDKLRPEQAAQLEALIAEHGDERLVEAALATVRRDNPPRLIQAFLGAWAAMPPPGQRLALVKPQLCTTHDWVQLDHAGICRACAGEAKERKA